MQTQERIKRAQEVMKLSNEKMASFLGMEESEIFESVMILTRNSVDH